MTYEEALANLRNHSGLSLSDESQSLALCIWQADQRGEVPKLADPVASVLMSLATANLELNGPVPSETFGRRNPTVILDLAYPISQILVDLLQTHRRWASRDRFPAAALDQLRDAALRIEMGWDMLLAGDHDDLLDELEVHWQAAV